MFYCAPDLKLILSVTPQNIFKVRKRDFIKMLKLAQAKCKERCYGETLGSQPILTGGVSFKKKLSREVV